MRPTPRLLLAAACMAALCGPSFAAEPDPIAALLAFKTIPEGGRYVNIGHGQDSVFYLQLPVQRSDKYAVGIVYRVYAEGEKIDGREMTDLFVARAANCKAKTIGDLGMVGFDIKGALIGSAPAAGFSPIQAGTADNMIFETLCDPSFEPKEDDIMTREEAAEDSEFVFDMQDLDAMDAAAKAKAAAKK